MDSWIYPCIQVSMDIWIQMDTLSTVWLLITKDVAAFWYFLKIFQVSKRIRMPGYLWIDYPLSKYP